MTKNIFNRKTKHLCIALATALMLSSTGCSSQKDSDKDIPSGYTDDAVSDRTTPSGSLDATADSTTPSGSSDSASGSSSDSGSDMKESGSDTAAALDTSDFFDGFFTSDLTVSDEATDSGISYESKAFESSVSGGSESMSGPGSDTEYNQQRPAAGLLTCGEWNDNENYDFYTHLVTENLFNFNRFGLNPQHRIKVTVLDASGTPVSNAQIAAGNTYAVTDINGTAYMFHSFHDKEQFVSIEDIDNTSVIWNNEQLSGSFTVVSGSSITINNNKICNQSPNGPFYNTSYDEITDYDVIFTADTVCYTIKQTLDVMFVFDTTGSMSDELYYLQNEFDDISNRIAGYTPRYSVNFYRDQGDEYVVRSYDFTYDCAEITDILMAQSVDGGGDYPEAVHSALTDAVFNHKWDENAIKLMFIILDAPPHSDDARIEDELYKAIAEAKKLGIRIIPVASSGVDEQTEGFLRTTAMLTGGTYTFLTDHSGIGNSHLEPTIGSYEVENLNDCIVRIIEEYYPSYYAIQ